MVADSNSTPNRRGGRGRRYQNATGTSRNGFYTVPTNQHTLTTNNYNEFSSAQVHGSQLGQSGKHNRQRTCPRDESSPGPIVPTGPRLQTLNSIFRRQELEPRSNRGRVSGEHQSPRKVSNQSDQTALTPKPVNALEDFVNSYLELMIDNFLSALDGFIQNRDGAGLADYFVLEPDSTGRFPDAYSTLIQFARNSNSEDQLEKYCAQRLPTTRVEVDGTQWYDFVRFTVTYLKYLTLVNPNDLLQTYNLLSDLVQYVELKESHLPLR